MCRSTVGSKDVDFKLTNGSQHSEEQHIQFLQILFVTKEKSLKFVQADLPSHSAQNTCKTEENSYNQLQPDKCQVSGFSVVPGNKADEQV